MVNKTYSRFASPISSSSYPIHPLEIKSESLKQNVNAVTLGNADKQLRLTGVGAIWPCDPDFYRALSPAAYD